jgi:hypothetical protein
MEVLFREKSRVSRIQATKRLEEKLKIQMLFKKKVIMFLKKEAIRQSYFKVAVTQSEQDQK